MLLEQTSFPPLLNPPAAVTILPGTAQRFLSARKANRKASSDTRRPSTSAPWIHKARQENKTLTVAVGEVIVQRGTLEHELRELEDIEVEGFVDNEGAGFKLRWPGD